MGDGRNGDEINYFGNERTVLRVRSKATVQKYYTLVGNFFPW